MTPDQNSWAEPYPDPIEVVDYHTAGEPFRILPTPPMPIDGTTVAQRRINATNSPAIDELRQLLCWEPRGHADMYGGFITAPDDAYAHFGVLFWHKDGFSTACGHGTIALGVWAVQTGRVPADPSGITDVVIDVPSGRVTARVHGGGSSPITGVDFVNVPSRAIAHDVALVTSCGDVRVELGWGGALYACLDVAQLGLAVGEENVDELIRLGREIKAALAGDERTKHPWDERLSGVYGTVFFERLGTLPTGELHQRNMTVFADGQVDRSPCGSGTAARVAVLDAAGELAEGQQLVHDSVVGSRFTAHIQQRTTERGQPSVIPVVNGNAYRTAETRFHVDPQDPLVPGFVLR